MIYNVKEIKEEVGIYGCLNMSNVIISDDSMKNDYFFKFSAKTNI